MKRRFDEQYQHAGTIVIRDNTGATQPKSSHTDEGETLNTARTATERHLDTENDEEAPLYKWLASSDMQPFI